jgi:hypothetical protein
MPSCFPNENVAAVVEVKSLLNTKSLQEAAVNIAAAKALHKTPGIRHPGEQWVTLGCVFAFKSSLSLHTICSKYRELVLAPDTGIGRHVDLIAVLDRGLVTLLGCGPGNKEWTRLVLGDPAVGPPDGFDIGTAPTELGDGTLDGFLRILLAHLSLFRHVVDHPGFDWYAMGVLPEVRVHHIATAMHGGDPRADDVRAAEHLKELSARFPGATKQGAPGTRRPRR